MAILKGLLAAIGLTILTLVLAVCFIALLVIGAAWLGTAIARLFGRPRKHGKQKTSLAQAL